jgi:hypothetical protein
VVEVAPTAHLDLPICVQASIEEAYTDDEDDSSEESEEESEEEAWSSEGSEYEGGSQASGGLSSEGSGRRIPVGAGGGDAGAPSGNVPINNTAALRPPAAPQPRDKRGGGGSGSSGGNSGSGNSRGNIPVYRYNSGRR